MPNASYLQRRKNRVEDNCDYVMQNYYAINMLRQLVSQYHRIIIHLCRLMLSRSVSSLPSLICLVLMIIYTVLNVIVQVF